jgi:hypothetical protein
MERHPRRSALHLGGAVLAALAGCSGGDDSSSDPDAGTGSYGITVRNLRDEPYDVEVVAQHIDGDPVFDRTVTAVPDGPKSWDEVLTEPGMNQVKAHALTEHVSDRLEHGSNYVDVGGENAPDVTDVAVEVYGHLVNEDPEERVTAVRVNVGDRASRR